MTPGQRPLAAFFVDLLVAVLAMTVLVAACGLGWAALQGMQAAAQARDAAAAATLAATMGAPGPLALLLMTAIGTGGAALLLYFWRRRATPMERVASAHAARRTDTWAWVVVVGLACFLWSSALTRMAGAWGVDPDPSNALLVQQALDTHPWALVLFALVLAPLYEELLFRRVLFGRLWAAGRPLLGIVLSSAAFALLHEIPGLGENPLSATALLWLVYAGMGAAFAVLYWRTGTLWAPIGAHALNNAIAVAALVLG